MNGTTRRDDEPLRWLRVGAGIAAAALLVGVAVTGAQLTWRYRPDGGADVWLLPASARWSRRLVRRHQTGLLLALPSVTVWGILTLRAAWSNGTAPSDGNGRGRALVTAASVAAVVFTLLSAFAWRLVKFDQIALWAVTVGADIRGLWYAAFSEHVRFVLVGDVEVSQTTVAVWVVVHLVAPVLALAAMATASRGRRRPTTRPAGTPQPPPG